MKHADSDSYDIYRLTWQGIVIEARYSPKQFGVIAHLEIETITPKRTPLPVTETGYRSHFHPIGTIERDFHGDVSAAVIDWLNEAAKDRKWRKYVEETRQLRLF